MTRLLLGSVMALAACDQQPTPRSTQTPTGERGYQAKIKALPPRQREGVLFRAIRAGGGASCQDIKQVADQPPAKNGDPAWLITCTDGAQWYVELRDDGTALVTGARAPG